LSDTARTSPAVSLWEFSSIAEGVLLADLIAKGAPVTAITTGTAHPGKYIVLVAGDTASVVVANEIVDEANAATLVDRMFLADIAPAVAKALVAETNTVQIDAEAAGVVETTTVAAAIESADAAVKDADVTLSCLRMADGLGGKAFFVVDGTIGEVTSSVNAASTRAGDRLVRSIVIPLLTQEIRADLLVSFRFKDTIISRPAS
jgi:bacterial microcompartment shell protein